MPRAAVDGAQVDFDDVGSDAPALLVMPGWCASRHAFDGLVPLLAKGHRVLSMDWRGHGRSGPFKGDFGLPELVKDALGVVRTAGSPPVVPVATAHAGWVALELRRRLGPQGVPGLVLVDWILGPPPPPFAEGLKALQAPGAWPAARDGLFRSWTEGVTDAAVLSFVRDDMGSYGQAMWSRAAREIEGAYRRQGSPLDALAKLTPPAPTLHVYGQPADDATLQAQRDYAAAHPWFHVERIGTKSHFPTIEAPAAVAGPALAFVRALRPPDGG